MKGWWKFLLGILCGLIIAGFIILTSSQPRGAPVALRPPPTPAPILVHVSGAVTNPGVYALEPGSRVKDALQIAGGTHPEANTQTLNLAAPLQDGARILVPIYPTATSPGAPPVVAQSNPVYPIDINLATQAELESLPGIGPVTAKKIIAYREENGPFNAIEEIQNVSGIGPKTFEEIKNLIAVGG